MDSTRRTALVAGLFYLITSAASLPAVFLLGPVLDDANYIVGSGADTRVIWGLLPRRGQRPGPHRHRRGAVPGGPAAERSCRARLLAVVTLRRDLAWELSLGVWLVVKGFKPSPITAGMAQPKVAA